MAKKRLNKIQAARRRDKRLMLLALALIFVPIVMMALGLGTPGRAFN